MFILNARKPYVEPLMDFVRYTAIVVVFAGHGPKRECYLPVIVNNFTRISSNVNCAETKATSSLLDEIRSDKTKDKCVYRLSAWHSTIEINDGYRNSSGSSKSVEQVESDSSYRSRHLV